MPSQEVVTCVFDKRGGLHKFWSEYTFLVEMTPSEKKYYKDERKLLYPLSIKKSGSYVYLEFVDPTSGSVQYTSEKFYRKDACKLYESSEQFRQAFDYVVAISVEYRIKQGLFQLKNNLGNIQSTTVDDVSDENNNIDEFIEEDDKSKSEIILMEENNHHEQVYESVF